MAATHSWIDEFPDKLLQLDAAHLRRKRRVVTPQQDAHLLVDGQELLAFCSNDYLGLARHPALIDAACQTARQSGVGASASPLVTGHSAENDGLERELAAFVQLPRALYFYAGYATNIGIVPALVGAGDAIFSDNLNHACLIDGARLSKASIHRYTHQHLAGLDIALSQSTAKRKLVMSDAVFSMDGDVADIEALYQLCEQHDALLLLDDAHGFGVLGEAGRGSLAQAGFIGSHAKRRILYMATLGKAAGVAGAFVAGDDALIEWLMQSTRSYIFATAAPAMLASALRASLKVIAQEQWRRDHLTKLIARLRNGLSEQLKGSSWQLLPSNTPIQPLVIGSNEDALAVMEGLRQRGMWVSAIRPPTVALGTARMRIALSATHSLADVDRLTQALGELHAELRLHALPPN
jgi:8-amino-7-oxononanoate synthase